MFYCRRALSIPLLYSRILIKKKSANDQSSFIVIYNMYYVYCILYYNLTQ